MDRSIDPCCCSQQTTIQLISDEDRTKLTRPFNLVWSCCVEWILSIPFDFDWSWSDQLWLSAFGRTNQGIELNWVSRISTSTYLFVDSIHVWQFNSLTSHHAMSINQVNGNGNGSSISVVHSTSPKLSSTTTALTPQQLQQQIALEETVLAIAGDDSTGRVDQEALVSPTGVEEEDEETILLRRSEEGRRDREEANRRGQIKKEQTYDGWEWSETWVSWVRIMRVNVRSMLWPS